MNKKKFQPFAATEEHSNWEDLIKRPSTLYSRSDDVRSPFARDYNRILHSFAYRRLKHKTQVFFNIDNDHICTRMEHVSHVESVGNTIVNYLGLNDELVKAIAVGHDLGHAPFGHQGEAIISELSSKHLGETFWHEKNGLYFADKIELLEDNYKIFRNLDLTYAVRDGIISHCGEINQNGLCPRKEFINLNDFSSPGQYQPVTWEGCVVKVSDKIAYIGRDIEDALSLGFLEDEHKKRLLEMARLNDDKAINTTVIMHNMIIDICENSTPEKGICLSDRYYDQLNELKHFNVQYIYKNPRFEAFKKYSKLVIEELFGTLDSFYAGGQTFERLERNRKIYPMLIGSFQQWLVKYCDMDIVRFDALKDIAKYCDNEKIYRTFKNKKIYRKAVLDFISGMTDRFAVKLFNELLTY